MTRFTNSAKLVLLLVAGAFFMENLDGTVIATALPRMAQDFGASAADVSIGMTAYLLTVAVFIPISGWIADRFGGRITFTFAIALFTFASALCGLSNTLWEFVGVRVLQGLAGALMVPVGRMVVLRATEKANLIHAIALITWPGLIAPVVGPPLGGFFTTYVSWRWIFFLNVPLGVLGIAMSVLLLNDDRTEEKRPFDVTGFMLSGLALGTLMYGINMVRTSSAGYVLAGLVIGAVAVWHLRRRPHPLIDLSLLRIPTFGATVWAGSLFRIVISVAPFLLPLMFQIGFGLDAFSSGLLVLAIFAGNLVMKTVTTHVLQRFGFRSVLLFNGVLVALSTLIFSFISPQTPVWATVVVLFFGGACRSIQFTSLSTLAFADVEAPRMSSASTLMSTIVRLTMAMGVAIGALALNVAEFARKGGIGAPETADFHLAFVLVSLLGAVGVALVVRLEAAAGACVSGHRAK